MKCPICQCNAYEDKTGNEGGQMMVAEEFDSCIECYDPDIKMYRCANNHSHLFYVSHKEEEG